MTERRNGHAACTGSTPTAWPRCATTWRALDRRAGRLRGRRDGRGGTGGRMTTQATETEAIRKSVIVPLPVEKACRLFTDGANSWWPLASHSIGGEEVETVTFDPEGSASTSGSRRDRARLGRHHRVEPPNRFLLDWRVNPEKIGTEVEVRFSADGDGRASSSSTAAGRSCGPASARATTAAGTSCSASTSARPRDASRSRAATPRGPAPRRSRARAAVVGRGAASAPYSSRSGRHRRVAVLRGGVERGEAAALRAFGSAPASSSRWTSSALFAPAAAAL